MTVVKELKKGGIIIISKPNLKVVNIVASARLGGKIDLEKTVSTLGKTMYEPEQFPGLIYRMKEPKVVILISQAGTLFALEPKENRMSMTSCTSFTRYSKNSNSYSTNNLARL